MPEPIIHPWTFASRVKDVGELGSWLWFFVFGSGGLMAWLAINTPSIHWAMVFLLSVGTMCLVALTFVSIDHYIRAHSIERCLKLRNIVPLTFAYDAASDAYNVGLAATLENTSKVSWIFARLVHGDVSLQGRTPDDIQIAAKIIEIGPESSARIEFPIVPGVKFEELLTGKVAVGIRYGRSKKNKPYLFYTETRLQIQVVKGQGKEMSGVSHDSVIETSYGRTPEADD